MYDIFAEIEAIFSITFKIRRFTIPKVPPFKCGAQRYEKCVVFKFRIMKNECWQSFPLLPSWAYPA